MQLTLDHSDHAVTFLNGDRPLMTYVHSPEKEPVDQLSPYPYIHPVHTRAGHVVTDLRPQDHPGHVWHVGVFLGCQNISENNFWGAGTFVKDDGYIFRDDLGSVEYRNHTINDDGPGLAIDGKLSWITRNGTTILEEDRSVRANVPDTDTDFWSLEFSYQLRNVTDETLYFTSPGSEGRVDELGRPGWGYGGLFWRGPMSMQNGAIIGPESSGEEMLDGESTAWLAFTGRVSGSNGVPALATLVFVDDPERHTSWFARSAEYPGVCFGLAARQRRLLPPGESITREHRIVVADGAWDRERVRAHLAAG